MQRVCVGRMRMRRSDCRWQKTLKYEAELKEIPASEILKKIQKGETVKYDHAIIKGNLDLREPNLPTQHVARASSDKKIWSSRGKSSLSDKAKIF